MKKRKQFQAVVSIALAIILGLSALPQNVSAAKVPKAGVKYVYKNDDPSTNIRTGIEAINLDGVTYYDIEQGRGQSNPSDGKQFDFFKKVLTGEASADTKNTKYTGKSNLLNQWAEVAEKIFEQNELYSADIYASGDFKDNFTNSWGSTSGYTDVSKALAQTNSQKWGSQSNDYTKIYGLTYADSLEKVRGIVCKEIVDAIDTHALDDEYEDHPDTFYSHTDGDNTLKALHDSKKQDVLFNIVTCIDDEGDTYCYHYNSFVLAFYDFKLVPLAGDGLRYITSAEGYNTLEEAANHEVPGVTFANTTSKDPKVSYYENRSKEPNSVGLSSSSSHEETASNTFSDSKSYNFSETIGYSLGIKGAVPFVGELTDTFNTSFTTGQVIETSFSETKSVSDSSTNTVSSNITLPPQTAATIEAQEGKGDMILDYKCPVGITYKVAITSMSGQLYADRAWTMSFKTAGYTQKTFSTFFGGDSEKGGVTARENLYKRTVSNLGAAGFEETYGNTYGYRDRHAGSRYITNKISWNTIFNGEIDPEETDIPYAVYYDEVDANGQVTGYNIDTLDKSGVRGFEYTITAKPTFNFQYTYKDKQGVEVTSDVPATLYKGNVKDSDGAKLDNTFLPSSNNKNIKLDKVDQKVRFFFTLDWKEVPEEYRPNNIKGNEENNSSGSNNNGQGADPGNNDTDDIKDIISWLSTHDPLSATGGTLSYQTESKSTNVGEIIPLYSLDTIKIKNNANFGDMIVSDSGSDHYVGQYIDANSMMDLTIYPGDKFLIRQIDLLGYNKNMIEYYGFNSIFGSWKPVEKDDQGLWVESNKHNPVASLVKDETSGNQYVLAGDQEGSYYIQYFINDMTYKSKQDDDYITNDLVNRPVIKLNIKKQAFDGTVSLSGDYTGMVGAEAVDLTDELSVFVTDASGKWITKDVTWGTKQSKGIHLSSDGKVTFDQAGSYQVRINVEDKYSDWVTIEAKEGPVLSKITFTKPDYRRSEITLTETKPSLDYPLDTYLEYYDQYGKIWTGDKLDVSFSLYDDNAGGSINDSVLTVTKEGDFKVYASATGYRIDPITISVEDSRKVGDITISGKFEGIVGDPEVNINDSLDVCMKDASGKEIAQKFTWDAQELKGITITEDGQVKAGNSGTYHVRVKNDSGQYSDWYAIKFIIPTVKISKTSLTINLGKASTLTAKNNPANAKNNTFTWTSNNNVVTVNNGQIKANKQGTAIVTVTNAYGSCAKCQVNIVDSASVATVDKTGDAISVSWIPVTGAQGYEVYGTDCNGKYKLLKTVGAKKLKVKFTKINKKKINKSCYKFYVKAYKMVNGRKVYISKTLHVHLHYMKSSKIANAKGITLSVANVVGVGKKTKLKATVKIQKNRKQLSHENAVRYLSSNSAIATVDEYGNVYGKSVGECYVYAITVNGKFASKKIIVR